VVSTSNPTAAFSAFQTGRDTYYRTIKIKSGKVTSLDRSIMELQNK
jgi:hypothetical protein